MLHIFANIVDENLEANSVVPDQTAPVANSMDPGKRAPVSLIWDYTCLTKVLLTDFSRR